MFGILLVAAVITTPQLAVVARVYKPGAAKSYDRAYILSADGSGFRPVSLPGQVVQFVEWRDDGLVYWVVGGQAWLVGRNKTGAIGLEYSERRTETLKMNETRMTSGDVIKWGEGNELDRVEVFGRTYELGIISTVRVGSQGWRMYFMEKNTMIESNLWCADARTRTFRPILTSQDILLDWHPDRSFVVFSPQFTDVPFDGQRVWSNELWVGTLGCSSRRLDLPTMQLWDVAVRPLGAG